MTIAWTTAKEYEDITYRKAEGIARIAIDRPEVHNAFNATMTLAVQATIRALRAARDLGLEQALDQPYTFIAMGTDAEALRGDQAAFASGKRQEWRLR